MDANRLHERPFITEFITVVVEFHSASRSNGATNQLTDPAHAR
jgi:hypothetical protein